MVRELIIADTQDITRLGIKSLVSTFNYISAITEVNSREELIGYLGKATSSIVLIDYTLLDINGTNELLILKSRFPQTDWILFSEDLTDEFLRQLIFNESNISVVLKTSSLEEIATAFSFALRGQRYICNRIATHLLNNNRTIDHPDKALTTTEKEILKEIASGKTTKEIASYRNVSVHTIITHRKNIFRKLEVNNIYEATKYAIRAGIIDIAEYYI